MTKAKATKKNVTREDIRAKIFSSKKFKSKVITLFGAKVEIHQPNLGAILQYKEEQDRQSALMDLLIGYCFIPGTDQKIFEEADKDTVMNMPFDDSILELNAAVEELTGLDIEATEGNLNATV